MSHAVTPAHNAAHQPVPSNTGGQTRSKIWTKQRVETFLVIIARYQSLLVRHTPVMVNYTWGLIAQEICKAEKFTVTGNQCYQKWKNLKKAYVTPRHFQLESSYYSQNPPPYSETVRQLHRAIKLKSERGQDIHNGLEYGRAD